MKLERDYYKLEERDKITKTKIRTWGDGTGTPFYEDIKFGESRPSVQGNQVKKKQNVYDAIKSIKSNFNQAAEVCENICLLFYNVFKLLNL